MIFAVLLSHVHDNILLDLSTGQCTSRDLASEGLSMHLVVHAGRVIESVIHTIPQTHQKGGVSAEEYT